MAVYFLHDGGDPMRGKSVAEADVTDYLHSYSSASKREQMLPSLRI